MRCVAVIGAAAVLGLAGCSAEEPGPSTLTPLASGSPSASAGPGPAPPSRSTSDSERSPTSEAATSTPVTISREQVPPTAQGASAFARHYMGVLTHAYQTADSSTLRTLSAPGCGGCNNFLAAIDGSAAVGEKTRGGVFEVVFAEAPSLENAETVVELRYSRTAAVIVTESGADGARLAADPPLDAQMRVAYGRSGWQVLGFRATPE